jgi:hypothetical protein
LISEELIEGDKVCAIGSVGVRRGIDMSRIDVEWPESVARAFGISGALAAEIEYMNDDWNPRATEGERWATVRRWVESQIIKDDQPVGATK